MPFEVRNERWRDGEGRKKRAGKVKRWGMNGIEYEDFSKSGAGQSVNPLLKASPSGFAPPATGKWRILTPVESCSAWSPPPP